MKRRPLSKTQKLLACLIFPYAVLHAALHRFWIEVRNIPSFIWCDIRSEWAFFKRDIQS